MKRILTIFFTFFSLAAAAQGGIDVSDVTVTTQGDSVLLKMRLVVSPEAVTKLQGMEVVPTLTGAAGEKAHFPAVLVNGRDRANIYTRHEKFGYAEIVQNPPYKVVNLRKKFTGDTVAYSARIIAEPWMENAAPAITYALVLPAGERTFYTVPVSEVVISAVAPAPAATPVSTTEETGESPVETVTTGIFSSSARLDFATASSELSTTSERNEREFDLLYRKIGEIIASGARITSVTVTGYSSPDGHHDTNISLAYDRAEAFAQRLQERHDLSDSVVKVRTAGENWVGLRAAVAESDMAHRDEILAVVDSTDAPDAKESLLRRMAGGEVWRTLEETVFPDLRKVDYNIDYAIN